MFFFLNFLEDIFFIRMFCSLFFFFFGTLAHRFKPQTNTLTLFVSLTLTHTHKHKQTNKLGACLMKCRVLVIKCRRFAMEHGALLMKCMDLFAPYIGQCQDLKLFG